MQIFGPLYDRVLAWASLVGRGGRFYLVAGLIVAGGERMAVMLPRYVERIGSAVVAIVLAAGVWLALGE